MLSIGLGHYLTLAAIIFIIGIKLKKKLKLLSLGNAMSGAPICIGIIQLANPTKAGIITPNTMINP